MTNDAVFNSQNSPIYAQSTNTYLVPGVESPPESDAAKSQVLYIATSNSTSVGSGSSLLFQIANPSNSGKSLYLSSISGGATAAATVTVYSGGTITGGTTPTPLNANFGSTNTSVMTTRLNTGTLGGTSTSVMAFLVSSGLFLIRFTGAIIVPPGKTVTVTIGTGSLSASCNFIWWES